VQSLPIRSAPLQGSSTTFPSRIRGPIAARRGPPASPRGVPLCRVGPIGRARSPRQRGDSPRPSPRPCGRSEPCGRGAPPVAKRRGRPASRALGSGAGPTWREGARCAKKGEIGAVEGSGARNWRRTLSTGRARGQGGLDESPRPPRRVGGVRQTNGGVGVGAGTIQSCAIGAPCAVIWSAIFIATRSPTVHQFRRHPCSRVVTSSRSSSIRTRHPHLLPDIRGAMASLRIGLSSVGAVGEAGGPASSG